MGNASRIVDRTLWSRRRFVGAIGAIVPVVVAACGGPAPPPTAAPARPTETSRATTAPTATAAALPTARTAGASPTTAVTPAVKPTPAAQPAGAAPMTALRMMFFHTQFVATFEEVIKNFRATNPNISVLQEAPATGDYPTKITLALAGGVAPDVFAVNWDMVRTFSQKKLLTDLNDAIKADAKFGADVAAIHPKIAPMMTWKGGTWAVAMNHDVVFIFWNKTLFDKMGVPPLTETVKNTWDWATCLDVAQKLTRPEDRQYGFYAYDLIGQTGYWSFVYANGGQIFSEDGSSADPLLKPEAIEAIQWIADTRLKYQVGPSPAVMSGLSATGLDSLFLTGKIGMGVSGTWRVQANVEQVKQFEWDVAPLPAAPRTGKRASIMHGTGFAVNRITKSPDQALLFAKHLATKETHDLYGKTGAISSARVDSWNGFYNNPNPPKHRDIIRQAVDDAVPHPLTGQWNIITYTATKPLESALQQIYTGKIGVEEGMKQGVAEFNRVLKEQVELTRAQA